MGESLVPDQPRALDEPLLPDSNSLQPFSLPLVSEILVVDDDAGNLMAIEAALGDLAVQVVRARSGSEALRYLLEHDCALILLDVEMPIMDGYETARLIRQRRRSRHTPIIFVTGHSRDKLEVLDAYNFGAVDFLFKPVEVKVLRAKAAVFVDLHKRTAEVAIQAERLRAHEERLHAQLLHEERRRWEEGELRRANTEMMATARRQDEFLAMLGHELRNPLAPIVTGLEVLRRGIPAESAGVEGQSDRNELLERTHEAVDRQVKHLSRLVDDLLDISRINSGRIELRREEVDLRQLVAQAVAASETALSERKHKLTQSIPPEPLWILADSVRVVQAISNLLNNAARYTDPCGRIELVCEKQDDWVELRLTDNGRGISPELLPYVFDMFVQERTTGSDGGMGLGLTLVKRLVSLHSGSVAVASGLSRPNGQDGRVGSVFTIRLPLGEPPRNAPPPAKDDSASDGKLRIALVEDNPDIRGTLEDLLVDLGHEVKAAPDGAAGVELITTMQPDVALVDIGLPKLDGYQVAQAVRRALGSTVRMVAMTGFGQAADKQRAVQAGFDAHLVKPAEIDTLLAALAGKYPVPAVG